MLNEILASSSSVFRVARGKELAENFFAQVSFETQSMGRGLCILIGEFLSTATGTVGVVYQQKACRNRMMSPSFPEKADLCGFFLKESTKKSLPIFKMIVGKRQHKG